MSNSNISYNTYIQETSVIVRLMTEGILDNTEYNSIMERLHDYYVGQNIIRDVKSGNKGGI